MSKDAYKRWYVQGLRALKSAGDQGKDAATQAARQITDPELGNVAEHGSRLASRHSEIISEMLKELGGDPGGVPNVIIDGIIEGNRQIVEGADDADVRDAAIIAGGQISLHYYIAAFGTLASTAKHLGMADHARTLARMVDEMKAQDERYTQLAETVSNDKAA